jgi:hypothetical protein
MFQNYFTMFNNSGIIRNCFAKKGISDKMASHKFLSLYYFYLVDVKKGNFDKEKFFA